MTIFLGRIHGLLPQSRCSYHRGVSRPPDASMPCRSGWTRGCGSPNDLAWPFSQQNMTRSRWHCNTAWGMKAILSAELYHRGEDATMRLWAYTGWTFTHSITFSG